MTVSTVFLALFAAATLWLAASVAASWTKALLLLVPLGLGAVLGLRRRKRPLHAALFLLFLPLASAALLELCLRHLPPSLLGVDLASMVQTPYRFASDGIYAWDAHGLRRLRPRLRRPCRFLGHAWLHETNGDGWRDDEGALASTGLVMGDSMVYGHGVERGDTLEARLEKATGQTVLNAGMQGSQALEELRVFLGPLRDMRPRWVVFMAHGTDPWDIGRAYDPAELQAFVDGAAGTLPRPLRWKAELGQPLHRRILATADGSAFIRATIFLRGRFSDVPQGPTLDDMQDLARPDVRLGWKAELRAIEALALACRRRGSRFLVIQSYLNAAPRKELAAFCREKGIDFADPWTRVEAARDRGETVILPRDGHPTGRGNALLAEEIAAWVGARPGKR